MDDDKKCKNLLCERTCDECKNEEEDFTIIETKRFPYKIPLFHQLMLIERVYKRCNQPITAFIKDKQIFIYAEDFNKSSKYLLHFQYPQCLLTKEVIPPEMTCDRFTPLN